MSTLIERSPRAAQLNNAPVLSILTPGQREKLIASGRDKLTIADAIKIAKDLPRDVRRVLSMRANLDIVECSECVDGLLVFELHTAHCDSCDRRIFTPPTPLEVLRKVFPERRQDS